MAGFLIVEGNIDEALKAQILNYKERLIAIQRILPPQPASSAGFQHEGQPKEHSQAGFSAVNGQTALAQRTIIMQPGAIERWRVLNGSVNGNGYIQFMVVEGLVPADRAAQEQYLDNLDNRQVLYLLAFDGVTLVRQQPGMNKPEYYLKKLDKDKTLVLAPANRADFLFKAPPLNGQPARVFTIVAKYYEDAIDDNPSGSFTPNIIVAMLVVRGQPVAEVDPENLKLPDVPELLKPITDEELIIPASEAEEAGQPNLANKLRTRQVLYSGWGVVTSPPPAPPTPPDKPHHTMLIDCQHFIPDNPGQVMRLNTAEEWTIWNCSLTVDGHRAVDHPLHIHVNPFWVIAVFNDEGEQMDLNGNLIGSPHYDFEPRWQDTVRLPRNGGRVIFRSRFYDFTGQFVHHCHILLHEDNGMMEMVEVVNPPQVIAAHTDSSHNSNYRLPSYVPKNPGYQNDPTFTVSHEECRQINQGDPTTCINVVLQRLRKWAV